MLIHMWEAVESHITCKAFQLGDPTANWWCGNGALSPTQHLDIHVVISTSQDRMLVMFLISFWLETQHQPALRISKVRKVSPWNFLFCFFFPKLYCIPLYCTRRYDTITMQYNIIWYNTIWYDTMQHGALLSIQDTFSME